jgi:hypothetical protein
MVIDTLLSEYNEQEVKERTGYFLQLVRQTIEVRVYESVSYLERNVIFPVII